VVLGIVFLFDYKRVMKLWQLPNRMWWVFYSEDATSFLNQFSFQILVLLQAQMWVVAFTFSLNWLEV
jgi:hypothetical protein